MDLLAREIFSLHSSGTTIRRICLQTGCLICLMSSAMESLSLENSFDLWESSTQMLQLQKKSIVRLICACTRPPTHSSTFFCVSIWFLLVR
uniref:Uncharacterized protein n=1 Tax=Salix viminalis TaxID=40686 RepID=A0A6N2LXR8_SALVM